MQNHVQALGPGEQSAIGTDPSERACNPRADVRAVFIRASMLRKLKLMSESGGPRPGCIMANQMMLFSRL
jgi:hypothetical protein